MFSILYFRNLERNIAFSNNPILIHVHVHYLHTFVLRELKPKCTLRCHQILLLFYK